MSNLLEPAGSFPPFPQYLQYCGPLMQGLLLLLVATFLFGLFRLWRAPQFSTSAVSLILAPTLIACGLAACQSLIAETVVYQNSFGVVNQTRPDRYIGYLRIYLAVGLAMSLILLCVAHFSRRTPK
jgi:hypothetical protein